MPSHFSVEQILSQSSISQNSSQYRYSENEDEKLLLDEAEQSYNRIANAITNTCINEMPNNTESSSQILQASHEQDKGSNLEIFDTGDLSGANLIYNNITFHVYPVLKIANERNSGTNVWPREKESDSYNLSVIRTVNVKYQSWIHCCN